LQPKPPAAEDPTPDGAVPAVRVVAMIGSVEVIVAEFVMPSSMCELPVKELAEPASGMNPVVNPEIFPAGTMQEPSPRR
jgi:hypothetical protein